MNKKQQKLLYFDRKEQMCKLIDKLYNLDSDKAYEIASNYETSIFEMFRVTALSAESIELTHLFNDEVYIDRKSSNSQENFSSSKSLSA